MRVQRYNFDYPKLYVCVITTLHCYGEDYPQYNTILCLNPQDSERLLSKNREIDRELFYYTVVEKSMNVESFDARFGDYMQDYSYYGATKHELNINKHIIPIIDNKFTKERLYDIIHHIYYSYRKYMIFKEYMWHRDILNVIFSKVIPDDEDSQGLVFEYF